MGEDPAAEVHLVGGDVPYFRRPLYHLPYDVLGGFVAGPPGS